MPGGLLNIIAYGNQNIILNGNPSKTFFKTVYAKYTNFGIQKFRLDFAGQRSLKETEESTFTFKVPRHAELLLDTYLVFDLPNIWSTIIPPIDTSDVWKPLHFKWIRNIGTSIIKEITISVGGQVLQKYSGNYIQICEERDSDATKKQLFHEMTGNVTELHSPQLYDVNKNNYPNAFKLDSNEGPDPSIRGRKIYVPLNFWFTKSSKVAFPLVCLQYSELEIEIKLRPIKELYTINDVSKLGDEFEYEDVQPNFTNDRQQLYRMLNPPPSYYLNESDYSNKTNTWDADIHLIANYCFLTEEESKVFANNEQKYLIKDVKEEIYYNMIGSQKVKINTNALVSNWMWYFRRTDAYLRNQWSNYTNWKRNTRPYPSYNAPDINIFSIDDTPIGPAYNIDTVGVKTTTNHYITPTFTIENKREILSNFAIVIDGKYRENEMDAGVYNYIEKYRTQTGYTDSGIYCYNFCLNSSSNELQPSGAMNLGKFKNIEFEITTIYPPPDESSEFRVLCDATGDVIGTTQSEGSGYTYGYDLYLLEERYNVLRFMGGNVGIVYAR